MATTRTMRIHGYGYDSTPVNIQASLNGTPVFSGEIPTLDQETVFVRPDQQVVLFTVQIPMEFVGNANVAITVNNGYVHYDYVDINYNFVGNPAWTSEQLTTFSDPDTTKEERIAILSSVAEPPFSMEDLEVLNNSDSLSSPAAQEVIRAHNAQIASSSGPEGFQPPGPSGFTGDCRPVVYIDGVEQQIPQPRIYDGCYSWGIDAGSTLYGNIIIEPAGLE